MQLFALLPRVNCGKCGLASCFAFAKRLANGDAVPDDCPELTAAQRDALRGEGTGPIRTVFIGAGDNQLTVGGGAVFDHPERGPFHDTVFCAVIAAHDLKSVRAHAERIHECGFVRKGGTSSSAPIEMVGLRATDRDARAFLAMATEVASITTLPLMLMADGEGAPAFFKSVAPALQHRKPLLCAAYQNTVEPMAALAARFGLPLVVSCNGPLEHLAALVETTRRIGGAELDRALVLGLAPARLGAAMERLSLVRRYALEAHFAPFGYPVLYKAHAGRDPLVHAALGVMNVAAIVTLDAGALTSDELPPLLTLRDECNGRTDR